MGPIAFCAPMAGLALRAAKELRAHPGRRGTWTPLSALGTTAVTGAAPGISAGVGLGWRAGADGHGIVRQQRGGAANKQKARGAGGTEVGEMAFS